MEIVDNENNNKIDENFKHEIMKAFFDREAWLYEHKDEKPLEILSALEWGALRMAYGVNAIDWDTQRKLYGEFMSKIMGLR